MIVCGSPRLRASLPIPMRKGVFTGAWVLLTLPESPATGEDLLKMRDFRNSRESFFAQATGGRGFFAYDLGNPNSAPTRVRQSFD